jgi:hypothetical protein
LPSLSVVVGRWAKRAIGGIEREGVAAAFPPWMEASANRPRHSFPFAAKASQNSPVLGPGFGSLERPTQARGGAQHGLGRVILLRLPSLMAWRYHMHSASGLLERPVLHFAHLRPSPNERPRWSSRGMNSPSQELRRRNSASHGSFPHARGTPLHPPTRPVPCTSWLHG